MKRREFITLIGGAAAWPVAARGQQPATPVVGILHCQSAEPLATYMSVFRRVLGDAGFIEGRTLAIEYRWADGQRERLPMLLNDLIQRRVSLIFAAGCLDSVLAAKAATVTIPIVFVIGSDPVAAGLIASLSRPGGNVTGMTMTSDTLRAKQVDLLRKLAPAAAKFGHLVNPRGAPAQNNATDVANAARALGWEVKLFNAANVGDLDRTFAALAGQGIGVLLVADDAFFNSNAQYLAILAARYRIAALHTFVTHPEAGSLMSYGGSREDSYRQAGHYVLRILKGEKPADLPAQQATKFELLINLKIAKALGIEIPASLLALADKVIE